MTGKGTYASKSIFLPAAAYGYGSGLHGRLGENGYYWSSTTKSDGSIYYAWCLNLNSGNFLQINSDRYLGFGVRPVRGFAK